jgi:hypothetical protein
MSFSNFLSVSADLAVTNPNAAQFIESLTNAETGNDLIDAIDTYDQSVLDAHTDVVAV